MEEIKENNEQEVLYTGAETDGVEEAVADDQPMAGDAEQTDAVDSRESLRKRLAEYNPEATYDTDEDFYGGLESYAQGRDEELSRHRTLEDNIRSTIEADPHSGLFLCNLLDGMDFMENLMSVLGPELIDMVNSPEARKKQKELMAKAQEEIDIRNNNEEQSKAVYEQWAEEKDTEKLEEFGNEVAAMLDDLKNGIVTEEILDKLWKGLNYDADVAEAEDTGRIQGRNEKITPIMRGDAGVGDGVPSLGAMATERRLAEKKSESDSGDIWERGRKYN